MRKQYLSPNHPEIANSLSLCADILRIQNKLEKAQKFYQECLEIRTKYLIRNHPETVATLNDLAIVMRALGRFEDSY